MSQDNVTRFPKGGATPEEVLENLRQQLAGSPGAKLIVCLYQPDPKSFWCQASHMREETLAYMLKQLELMIVESIGLFTPVPPDPPKPPGAA